MRNPDPAFERAPKERRYTGKLSDLFAVLKHEAFVKAQDADSADNPWAWRVLPGGAFVGLQIWHDMRKEVRIARIKAPETLEAREAWERETQVFRKHLGIEAWHRMLPTPEDEKCAAVRYCELRPGEIAPEVGECGACGKEIRYEAALGATGQRCTGCAAAAGAAYTAERERERGER